VGRKREREGSAERVEGMREGNDVGIFYET